MTVVLSFPDFVSYFGRISVGVEVAGCLIVAFMVLAMGFGIYRTRRMKQRMNLLADETRARRAQEFELEEQLCGVDPSLSGSRRAAPKAMKDPWQN